MKAVENDGKYNVYEKCGNISAKKKQELNGFETRRQWQLESPAREYLEQVKCCSDIDCTHRMMKQWFFALKSGEWEEYKNTFRK